MQIARLTDGTRKVISISEVTGVEGDVITMQDIFVFERRSVDESGKVKGVFRATVVCRKFSEKLATMGCRLRPALFDSSMEI